MATLAIFREEFDNGEYAEGLKAYKATAEHTVELLKQYYVDLHLSRWEEGNWNEDIPEDFQTKALGYSITVRIGDREKTYQRFEDFGTSIKLVEITESEADTLIKNLGIYFGQWPEW